MVGHWDDASPQVIDRGPLQGTRHRLGPLAGCARLGLSRYLLGPGQRAMPLHAHADEEELFVVLGGRGISVQGDAAHEVREGDVILHRAGAEPHTIVGAGDGLDVLAFSSGSDTHLTWLPRAGVFWAGPHWIPHDGPSPFEAEAAAGPLELPEPSPRPATIGRFEDMPDKPFGRGDVGAVRHVVGQALGAVRSGMQETRVAPGKLSSPPHHHSSVEELFVVLGGSGVCVLGDDEHPVRRGSLVARPPSTRVAHTFRAGDEGLWMLAYSDRAPGDMCFYPRSGMVGLLGIQAYFKLEAVDYWEMEGGF